MSTNESSINNTKFIAFIQVGLASVGIIGLLILQPMPIPGLAILLVWLVSLLTLLWHYPHMPFQRLSNIIHQIYSHYWLSRAWLIMLMSGFVIGSIALVLQLNRQTLLATLLVAPSVIVWPWLALISTLAISGPKNSNLRSFAIGLLKIFAMLGAIIVFVEVLLQLTFTRLPVRLSHAMPQAPIRIGGIRYDTPHGAREYPAGQIIDFTVHSQYGDLFSQTCLSPEDAPPADPYQIHFVRDRHGFRNPEPWPDQADVVVIGDSFIEAVTIQNPFWQDLTPNLLAFGLAGTGTLEQTLMLEAYGLPRKPQVVIVTWFEGNDLTDNWAFHEARQQGESVYNAQTRGVRPWEYLVTFNILSQLLEPVAERVQAVDCQFPVEDSYGNPLAFLPPPVALSTISADKLRDSAIFAVTREAILTAAQQTQATGAQFVLVFMPHKAHAYWPGLLEAQQIALFSGYTAVFEPTETGLEINWEINDPHEIADYLITNIEAQRELLAELAVEGNFAFLDLTPHFQEAAKAGQPLYFYGDTHWNQQGHDLAKGVLQDFLIANQWLESPDE